MRLLPLLAIVLSLSGCTLKPLHEQVSIEGPNGKLVGEIDRPAIKASKAPTVIICHGLTGWRSENHLMAVRDSLLANGFATVRFDFDGHGESDGPFSHHTLQSELDDLHAIYDYVSGLDWVDKSRIAVAGHSQGGLLTGVFAGDMGREKVRCALMLAPAGCIYTQAKEGKFFGIDISEMPDSIPFWGGRHLCRKYFEVARDVDAYSRAAAYDGPVLLVLGDQDDPGIYAGAKAYLPVLKDVEYHELPGLTHCFPEDYATPAHLSAEFVKNHIK